MKKFIKDTVGDALNSQLNEAFNDGYNEAANICVGVITKKIDELFSKINSNSSLSNQEQFMLLKLKELKSETEEELRGFSSGNE
ncbi:hypothetical protein Q7A53_09055 [Halobacillus rhizosphaerae]|uniref:hypothetical protein n=1 Tax=Halobacillus rhizosphaerae TaxID=3064889 RepID=UPI00398A8AB6